MDERRKAETAPHRAFLIGQDISPTEDNIAHLEVLVEALRTYDERSAVYGQLWRQYGALSNLLSVARKTDRLMEEWWHTNGAPPSMHKDALDDANDLINYTVFFMRNARVMNLLGSRPKRPESECSQCGFLYPDDVAHPGYPKPHACNPRPSLPQWDAPDGQL